MIIESGFRDGRGMLIDDNDAGGGNPKNLSKSVNDTVQQYTK